MEIYEINCVMYEFCVEEGIDDIERLELEQIKKLETIVARKVANVKNSMQIVDNSRKILFMSGKEIHWHANVWYIDFLSDCPRFIRHYLVPNLSVMMYTL